MKKIIIPPVFFIASILLISLIYFILPGLNYIIYPYNLSGIIVVIFGFIIIGKARGLFAKYKTPHNFKLSIVLINEGIYGKTRNPMYVGFFVMLVGIVICFGNLLSFVVPLLFIFSINKIFIPFEENMMLDIFGDKYKEYTEKVKRWF